MDSKRALAKSFGLYVLIGCCGAGTDATLFITITSLLHTNIYITNFFTVAIGATISFLLNRHFNFKVKDHPVRRGFTFFGVCLLGMGLSQLILWICSTLGIPSAIAKLISLPIVGVFQFTLNKTISFRKTQ